MAQAATVKSGDQLLRFQDYVADTLGAPMSSMTAFVISAFSRHSTVGAILPSSSRLADAMARTAVGAQHLIELGAGRRARQNSSGRNLPHPSIGWAWKWHCAMAYKRASVPRPSTGIDLPDNCIYASERLTAVPGTLEACKTATEAGVCSGANGATASL